MQVILDFILQYWKLIVIILFSVVEFVLLLILKKHPIIQDLGLTNRLLNLVNTAEDRFGSGHGPDKLSFVIKTYRDMYPDDSIPDFWIIFIVKSILHVHNKSKGGN